MYKKIMPVIVLMILLFSVGVNAAGSDTCEHINQSTSYMKIDEYRHREIVTCEDCGEIIFKSLSEDHSRSYSYEDLGESGHRKVITCSECGFSETKYEDHTIGSSRKYEKFDADNHYLISLCLDCGHEKSRELEKHYYANYNTSYNSVDCNKHEKIEVCDCGEKKITEEKHNVPVLTNAKDVDETYHGYDDTCLDCKYTGIMNLEEHDFEVTYYCTGNYKPLDMYNHLEERMCSRCGEKKYIMNKHDSRAIGEFLYKRIDEKTHAIGYSCLHCEDFDLHFTENHNYIILNGYKKIDDMYHEEQYKCLCGDQRIIKAAHKWGINEIIRRATLQSKGIKRYYCSNCQAFYDKYYSWSYNEDYEDKDNGSCVYDITDHSIVYRNSKTITVKMKNALKGSILKIKIGKKTFSKKIGKKKKVNIKLKKLRCGSKISMKLYYKGKLVGKDKCKDDDMNDTYDYVMYGKSIKKGMSKSTLKWVPGWREYDRTGSSSGGWTYWYYSDGSYVGFKNGKVRFWYNAE